MCGAQLQNDKELAIRVHECVDRGDRGAARTARHTLPPSQIASLSGDYYAAIETSSMCPTDRKAITAYPKQPLSSLNVSGRISTAYYDPGEASFQTPHLYLMSDGSDQYYRIALDKHKSRVSSARNETPL